MLVLDYPRTMTSRDDSLLISPFHTGHLGLRPKTEITVQLLKAPTTSTAFCELVVSPFGQSPSGLAVLTAVMQDKVGVVERLVSALAELGINIDAEESASIAYLDRHSVSLTLDLDALGPGPSDDDVPLLPGPYREYAAYVPLHDPRCRKIFETVMRKCVDVLAIRTGALQPTLDLSIRLLDVHPKARTATATLAAHEKQMVKLPLPDQIRKAILSAHGPHEGPDLVYLFLSDTDDRTLRVFFLPSTTAASLYHVAVHHRDRTNALGTLLSLTTKAEFNILTSLVGSGENPGENVWEAVLEYRPENHADADGQPERPLDPEDTPAWLKEKALPWLRDKLASTIEDPASVASFDFVLSEPGYPRPKGPLNRFPLVEDAAAASPADVPPVVEIDPAEEIELRRRQISVLPEHERPLRRSILDRIGQRRSWPMLFLAYTSDSSRQAELVRARLSERYQVLDRDADEDGASPDRADENRLVRLLRRSLASRQACGSRRGRVRRVSVGALPARDRHRQR